MGGPALKPGTLGPAPQGPAGEGAHRGQLLNLLVGSPQGREPDVLWRKGEAERGEARPNTARAPAWGEDTPGASWTPARTQGPSGDSGTLPGSGEPSGMGHLPKMQRSSRYTGPLPRWRGPHRYAGVGGPPGMQGPSQDQSRAQDVSSGSSQQVAAQAVGIRPPARCTRPANERLLIFISVLPRTGLSAASEALPPLSSRTMPLPEASWAQVGTVQPQRDSGRALRLRQHAP